MMALFLGIGRNHEKCQCSNYRPVSLTCAVSKLMEHHVVCSSIMNHTNMHNILYQLQHGFCADRSCETQLIDLVNDTINNMQSDLQTDICVLDFAKAIDKVSHIRLIRKMSLLLTLHPTNDSYI